MDYRKSIPGGTKPAYDEFDPRLFFSYAIPNDEALQVIARLAPIVEIGAGTGYWAALLASRGVDIVPYDPKPYGVKGSWASTAWINVRHGDHTIIDHYPKRAVLMCWPLYGGDYAIEVARRTQSALIYIGEPIGGCNSPDEFFDILERDWTLHQQVNIPQWMGLHDQLQVWKRKDA